MSWVELNQLLERGQGLVCRRDLRAAGVHRNWIAKVVQRGDLAVVHPQVYSVPGLPMDVPTRFRAALMQAGPDARLSHTSAMEMYGVLRDHNHDRVHVAVPIHTRLPFGIAAHQVSAKPDDNLIAGFPVVSIRDALAQSVSLLPLTQLRFPAMQAVQDKLLTARQLADVDGLPGHSRMAMRLLGEEASAGAESGGEANFYRLLLESHLPVPVLQHRVMTFRGEKRLDAYWPEYRLCAEIDGKEFHAREADFETDPQRRNAIQAERIVVINFPVSQVMGGPMEIIEDCEANLLARAADLGVPTPWLR